MIDFVERSAELLSLLRNLDPIERRGVYVFCELPPGVAPPPSAVAWFRDEAATTLIVDEPTATALCLGVVFRAAWIRLGVESELSAVGLTAAVAAALARQGISCNVVAASRHDHLFVPVEHRAAAMNALAELVRWARGLLS